MACPWLAREDEGYECGKCKNHVPPGYVDDQHAIFNGLCQKCMYEIFHNVPCKECKMTGVSGSLEDNWYHYKCLPEGKSFDWK